jgi:hypothetical protein
MTCPIRSGFRPRQFIVLNIAVTDTISKWCIAARPTRKRRLGAKPPGRRDNPRFNQINDSPVSATNWQLKLNSAMRELKNIYASGIFPTIEVFTINVGFVRSDGSVRTEVLKNVIDFNRRRVRQENHGVEPLSCPRAQ